MLFSESMTGARSRLQCQNRAARRSGISDEPSRWQWRRARWADLLQQRSIRQSEGQYLEATGYGGESVSQLPLKDEVFWIPYGQYRQLNYPPKTDVRFQSLLVANESSPVPPGHVIAVAIRVVPIARAAIGIARVGSGGIGTGRVGRAAVSRAAVAVAPGAAVAH